MVLEGFPNVLIALEGARDVLAVLELYFELEGRDLEGVDRLTERVDFTAVREDPVRLTLGRAERPETGRLLDDLNTLVLALVALVLALVALALVLALFGLVLVRVVLETPRLEVPLLDTLCLVEATRLDAPLLATVRLDRVLDGDRRGAGLRFVEVLFFFTGDL